MFHFFEFDYSGSHISEMLTIFVLIFLFVWLISLSIMSSGFIHVVACTRNSFHFKASACMHKFCLSIHLSMDAWVAFTFWLLCIVLLMNMGVQRSFQGQEFNSFEYIPRGGLLSPAVILHVIV